ncbi:MAG: BatA domain-containing protein [Saprospiraceae bacterium]
MQFVFPWFLAAAAAIAIPIIIHLFYFRRFKRVYFTNVAFLKEVKEETNNSRRLRNLLVLLMRCLAFLFLVLAFAQPFIPRSESVNKGEKAVSVYIDNSFSMEALSKDAPLLEVAKQRARDIVRAYAPQDRFQILTNDFEGRDQRLVGQEDALARIDEIGVGPASRELSKVLLRQRQCLESGKAEARIAYLLSDFQKKVADLSDIRDTLTEVWLTPIRAVQERNVGIDSAWFESPVQVLGQTSNLLLQVSNYGPSESEDLRLSLEHEGQTKPAGAFSLAPGATRIDTVKISILRPGIHQAKISVSDYPIQFDDDYYISFAVAEQIRVLSINGAQPNRFVSNAFAGASYFRIDQADYRTLNYAAFANYQLILLNELPTVSSGLAQELKAFADNGGNVLVFPAPGADLSGYNTLTGQFGQGAAIGAWTPETRIASQLNTDEYTFNDVYLNKNANLRLPTTKGNYKLNNGAGETIISYRDGSAMLIRIGAANGNLYVCASPIDEQYNDLVRNADIFVPMLFNMAVSGSKNRRIAYVIGRDEVVEAKHYASAAGEIIYRLRKMGGQGESAEFIPQQRIVGPRLLLTPGAALQQSGWYGLRQSSDTTLAVFAFNYDRRESDMQFADLGALSLPRNVRILDKNAEANFSQVVNEQSQGIVLWRWCLIFALMFLLLEALILRFFKV